MADNIKVTFQGEIGDILKAFKRIEGKLDTLVKNADKSTKAMSKDFSDMATRVDASLQKVSKSASKASASSVASLNRIGMATRRTATLISKQTVTANLLKMSDGFTGFARQGVLSLAELNASGIRFGQTMSRVAGLVVRRFGSIALSFATIGAGVFTGKAVAGAVKFETAMANVGTILADGAPKLEVFRQATLGLATATSKDLVDLTEGLYSAISAGIPQTLEAGGAIDFLKNAALAAQTGLAETKDAVLAGTVVLNTFGRSAGSNTEIFDKMFEAVRLGVFTFDEMAVSLGKGAGIAKTANLTFNEYLSTMTAISTKGRTASQSVTALRQLIISIATPTTRAKEIAKQYGFELGQNAIRAKGFKKVLEEMTRGIGQNVGALKKVLRRVEGLTGAAALGADDLARFALTFDSITDASGRLSEAAEFQEATLTHNFNLMRNQFAAITAEVVQSAIPALIKGFKDIRLAMEDMNQVSLRSGFKGASEGLTDLIRLLFSLRSSFVLLFKVILLGKALAFFKGVVGSMTASIGAAVLRTEQWSASMAKNTTVTTVNTAIQKNHAAAMISNIKAAGVAAVSQDNLSRAFFGNIKASGLATAGVVANTVKLGFMATAAKGAAFAMTALNKALSLLGILTGIGAIIFVLVEMISLLWTAGQAAGALWEHWTGAARQARKETDKVRQIVDLTAKAVTKLIAEIKGFAVAFVKSPFIKAPGILGELTGVGFSSEAVIKEYTKAGKKIFEIDDQIAEAYIGHHEDRIDSLIAEAKRTKAIKEQELENAKFAAEQREKGLSGDLVSRHPEKEVAKDKENILRLEKEITALTFKGKAFEKAKLEISGQSLIQFREQLKAKQDAQKLKEFPDGKGPGSKRRVKDLLGPLLERERIKSARNEITTIKRRTQALIVEAKARENLADKAGLLNSAEKLIITTFDKRKALAKVTLEQQLGNVDRLSKKELEAINKATEVEKKFADLGADLAQQKEFLIIKSFENSEDIKENIEQQHTLKMAAFQAQLTKELKVLGENRLKDYKAITDQIEKVTKDLVTQHAADMKKEKDGLIGLLSTFSNAFVSEGFSGLFSSLIDGAIGALEGAGLEDIADGILRGGFEGAKDVALGVAEIFGARLSKVLRDGISFLQGMFTSFLTSNFSKFVNMAGSNEVLDISEGVGESRAAIGETAGSIAHGDRLGTSGSNDLRMLVKEQKKAKDEELKKIADLEEEKEASQFDNQIKAEFAKAEAFINGLVENLPILFDLLPGLMDRLLDLFVSNLPKITQAFIDSMPLIIQKVIRALPVLYNAVIGQIPTIMNGIIDMLPMVFEEIANAVPHIIFNIVKHFPAMIDAIIRFVIQGIPRILFAFLSGLLEGLKDVMREILKMIPGMGPVADAFDSATGAITRVAETLERVFGGPDDPESSPDSSGDREGGGQGGVHEGPGGIEIPGNFGLGGRQGAGGLKPLIPGLNIPDERTDPVRTFVQTGQKILETLSGVIPGFVANQQASLLSTTNGISSAAAAAIPANIAGTSGGGNTTVVFNARGGSSAVVQKAFAEMFVAEVRKDGVAVRRPSEIARSGPTNFPRTNRVVTE